MAIVKVFLLLLVVALASSASAKRSSRNKGSSYPAPKPHKYLKFNSHGKFRIMQIADVHYQNGATTACEDILPEQNPCSDVNSTVWLAEALKREKPDLAIFTGDNIVFDGNNDIIKSLHHLTQPLRDAKVPWMITYGNHDCEDEAVTDRKIGCRHNLTKSDMLNELSLTKFGPEFLHGTVNYAYSITGRDGEPKHVLYVFDGGAYDQTGPMYGYDLIRADQVDWFNKTSIAMEKAAGRKVPSTAWFHIPVPEYDTAFQCMYNHDSVFDGTSGDFGVNASMGGMGKQLSRGCNGTLYGVHQEGVYSAATNGGLFAAMVERGDIKMANVGHDHLNDFCANLLGIELCYSGGFGYHAYGRPGFPRRARIVDLSEDGTIFTYKVLDSWGGFAHVDPQTI